MGKGQGGLLKIQGQKGRGQVGSTRDLVPGDSDLMVSSRCSSSGLQMSYMMLRVSIRGAMLWRQAYSSRGASSHCDQVFSLYGKPQQRPEVSRGRRPMRMCSGMSACFNK